MIKVSVTSVGKSYKKLEPQIAGTIKRTFGLINKKGDFFVYPELVEWVSVYLVDNTTMRKLNRTYRGKNKATNVLSFVAPKGFIVPQKIGKDLGEIYLAPDFIKKNNEDMRFLLIHGFLHLLGFNHKRKSDTIRMQLKEQGLFKQLRT